MDDSLSSVSSLDTRSETTASSVCSDMDMSSLQGEILRQSQAIESFIQNPGADRDSAMAVLKSLFTLFKSELALNISLRKRIVREKRTNEKNLLEVEKFFKAIGELGFDSVSTFGDIVNVLNDLVTALKREAAKRKRATELAAALETQTKEKLETMERRHSKERTKFQTRISEILNEKQELVSQFNSALKEKKAAEKDNVELCDNHQLELDEKDRKIEELQCDIRRRQNQKAGLREDIDELKKQLKSAKAETQRAKEELASVLEENEALKTDNRAQERLLAEAKAKAEKSESFWKEQVTKAQEEADDLKRKNTAILEKERLKREEMEEQWSEEMEKQGEVFTTIENDMKKLKRRCDKKATDVQVMKHRIQELEGLLAEMKAQLAQSREDLSTAKSACVDLQDEVDCQKAKVRELEDQLVNRDEHNKKLKSRMKQQSKDTVQRIDSDWQVRLDEEHRKRAAAESALRESNDRYTCEVQSLKDMIRKLTFNLEREEADNARLHAQLQMQTVKRHHRR